MNDSSIEKNDTVTAAEAAQTPTENIDPRQALLTDIGQKLMSARLSRKETLDEPARKLKLRRTHLEALESGSWDSLHDPAYTMGFLRQYSGYLQLDLSAEIEQLKNNDYRLTKPLTFPDPPVAPSHRWAWLSATAFVILLLGFNYLYQDRGTHATDRAPNAEQNQTTEPTTMAQGDTVADLSAMNEPLATQTDQQLEAEPAPVDLSVHPQPATTVSADVVTQPPVAQADTHRAVTATSHLFSFEAADEAVWIQISLPDRDNTGKGR
ncbi:MAG: helix-turn-helix domain-containing protein, partial [Mariprofundus sp.]